MNDTKVEYRIIDGADLFRDLKPYGFQYCGNYYRGDNWIREMDEIDGRLPINGIVIHGDWDNRKILFKFPYRKSVENLSIVDFIQDLIDARLVEPVESDWKI